MVERVAVNDDVRGSIPRSPAIRGFNDPHRWLSNFYPSKIILYGLVFPTVEHAYQAMKCPRSGDRAQFAYATTPGLAKRMGSQITLRSSAPCC